MHMQTPQSAHHIDLEAACGSGAYQPAPVVMVRGQGARLWDADGNEYLDLAAGIGVAALGHAHPLLTQALAEQANMLITCANGYYHNDVRLRLLQRLTALTPPGLKRVFLCNSGSEAVETAIKLARAHTRRPGIIAASGGFHGRTLGALSATWNTRYREPFAPLLADFVHVPFGDAQALEGAVNDRTAAVLLEPIQGEAGVHPAPAGYLHAARRLCDERGALLVFDEVQCGMGRTGRWFACQGEGVTPDVLCLAKALGGGLPIGAAVFQERLRFEKGQHGSTFGGNPLACRAALAVIDAIEAGGLLDNVVKVGAHFLEGLRKLAAAKPLQVRQSRGRGLMLALELRHKAVPVLKGLMVRGVLALSAGPTTLRFLPPYILTVTEADEALVALEEVLS